MELKTSALGSLATRIEIGLVASAALASLGYLLSTGLDLVSAAITYEIVRTNVPVMLGLPIPIALAAALVLGTQVLQDRSHIELPVLRAKGACAIVAGRSILCAALAIALPSQW